MSKNKILILGGKGMLGTDLQIVLQGDYDVISLDREDGDITNIESLNKTFTSMLPQWIVNCAAFTAVDLCETEQEKALAINGYALKNVAQSAKKVGAKVIHISTDYVFDGSRKAGYTETDIKNPLSVYGTSKALGEDVLLQEYPEGSYIVRTAWLYGKYGKNFVFTMLDLATQGRPLRIVDDQIGSPTHTIDLSKGIKYIMDNSIVPDIYHVTNSGAVSWYEFAKEIFRLKRINVTITPVSTEEFPRPAKRPAYSILKNTKLPSLRPWQEALHDFLTHTL